MAAIVYLDVEDEITSAATRIRTVPERRVAIVLPSGSRVSTSRINFRLLAREASLRSRDLAIVAPEASTRALAASAGLPVFASVAEYEDALEADDAAGPDDGSMADDASAFGDGDGDGDGDGEGDESGVERARAKSAIDAAAAQPAVVPAPTVGQLTGWWAQDADATTPRSAAAGADPAARRRTTTPAERGFGAGLRPRSSVTDTVALPIPEPAEDRRGRGPSRLVLALVSMLLVLLVIGGVAGWIFLPSASVTVAAKVEPVGPLQFTVRADPLEVTEDPANGIVPAQVVTFDLAVSQDFPASGKKVTETKASGRVSWTNCDPTRSYTIPAATIVKTGNGSQFTTGDAVFLPVAILSGNPPSISCQSREVSISARASGPEGNVDAGTITVVPADYNSVVIRVTNPDATTGGTHTEARIVAQKDVDAAMATLSKALRDDFTAQLANPARAPAGLTLFPSTRSMSSGDPSVDPASLVGQAVPTFTLGLTGTGTATAVDPAVIVALGDERIRAAVPTGRSLVKGSVDVRLGTAHVDGSAVVFPVTARASLVNVPDATVIRKVVKGLPVDDARERLRDYGDATVDVWPGWVTTITTYDFRLEVKVVSDIATEPATPSASPPPSFLLPSSTPAAPSGSPAGSGVPAASGSPNPAGSGRATAKPRATASPASSASSSPGPSPT